MLKYHNAMVVFEEVPDEVTLTINITNCPCRCDGCHSPFLWEDTGEPLTFDAIDCLVEKNKGITCVCLMGGDREPKEVEKMGLYIKTIHGLKSGWYSGMDELPFADIVNVFDYIKIGHYDKTLGGLDKETTNQRFYRVAQNGTLVDESYKFRHKIK